MSNLAMLVGRILMSAIFIQAGYSKLMNVSGTISYFEGVGLPVPALSVWVVIALELVGGLALLLGFHARLAALALAGFSIAAGAIGHSNVADLMHFQALMKDIAIGGWAALHRSLRRRRPVARRKALRLTDRASGACVSPDRAAPSS